MRSYECSKEEAYFKELQPKIMLDGRIMSLGQMLYAAASQFPDSIALITQERSITYKELSYHVGRFAQVIKERGVQPHDRVLLFFENSIEFYIGYHAITQVGAVVAPLNTFLRERELAHIIGDCQAKLLVASHELLGLLKEEHITNLPTVLTEKDMPLQEQVPDNYMPEKPQPFLAPDDMAALLYTSGTTGLPKGVMLSSRNIFMNIIQGVSRLGFTRDERVFGVLPLFHSFAQVACVWAPSFLGCAVILVPKIERRHIFLGLQHKPTFVLGVPALFGLMCLMKTADFSNVKYFISGGDALPDRIRAAFALVYNRKLCCGYGLSETTPILTGDIDDETVPTNTVGRPLIDVSIEIRDDKGTVLPQEKIGLIWVTGPNIMLGYYNAPEKTAEVIQNGWLNTGDLGYLDEKGKLVITGREKDIIINKGFKIYPQEVENIISSYPLVIRVGVVGIPDEAAGQVSVAYVQLRENDPMAEKQIRELCVRSLAAYKIPRYFYCSAENLPITATGKVDKKKLGK